MTLPVNQNPIELNIGRKTSPNEYRAVGKKPAFIYKTAA